MAEADVGLDLYENKLLAVDVFPYHEAVIRLG
jgi:hypothetical protein